MPQHIRIAGASGYWGDAQIATEQLLQVVPDFVVYDYLAEITLGIMAAQRAKDPAAGYATDFVTAAMAPNLRKIAEQNTKIISNAGGMNPTACAAALRAEISSQNLGLTVATVTGDDLMPDLSTIAENAPVEMFSGAPFPDTETIQSINTYFGAVPIAAALATGADIVVTGRCVDSAVTLGAALHAFGWAPSALDLLAAGSLAGHLIECGAQATGGNFTDWRDSGPADAVGYPFVDLCPDGRFHLSKPLGTGGIVTPASVGEQMLYEIGDPQSYALPDVVCDFSDVEITQDGPDRVLVTGAKGQGVPDALKTSLIHRNGWRTSQMIGFYGMDAGEKAQSFADAVLRRTRDVLRAQNAPDFDEILIEILGSGAQMGAPVADVQEVVLKIAARHTDRRALGLLLKELSGLALAGPPGISGFAGGRAKPSPVMALHSYLTPKSAVVAQVTGPDGATQTVENTAAQKPRNPQRPAPPDPPKGPFTDIPLIQLAYARSGDKGDSANVGVLPRDPALLPAIWHALTDNHIRQTFAHVLSDTSDVQKFLLPGTNSINILMTQALGGGGFASLRNDPQGKGFAQILLARPIPVPTELAEAL